MKKSHPQEPKIISPTVLVKLAEPTTAAEDSAEPEAVVGQISKRFRLVYIYRPRVMVTMVIALLLLGVGLAARPYYVHSSLFETPANGVKQAVGASKLHTQEPTTAAEDAATATQQGQSTKPSSLSSTKSTVKSSTPAVTSTLTSATTTAPTPAPVPNTTNCLPPNPSPYATYYISKTNSQYLQINGYANTTKMYTALQFAGLLDTINSKQYVVLAMDDSQWNSFSQAQLNWMNASPANMRSVIGWQVITSCITWNGMNSVKDMATGATRVVTTLNGPVTYVHGMSGLGTFGSGNVAIWDWFTSNGSVTIAGFVNTTSIP